MAFKLKKGKTKFIYLPMTTSTVMTTGALTSFSGGLLIAATSSSASADIIGVIRHTIASTDSDYATARSVEVEVPVERFTIWEADVTSGLVATDIMTEVDLTNSLTVNRGASSIKAVRCVSVISGTKGLFLVKFLGGY